MKKILSKVISSTDYLTETHLEWLGTNQSVWVHRRMTCYMNLTQQTSLCEQKHSVGLVQLMRLRDWLLFYLSHMYKVGLYSCDIYWRATVSSLFRSTQAWNLNFQNCYMHDQKNLWLFCRSFPVRFTSSPNKSVS